MEGTTKIDSLFWIGTSVMVFLAFGLIFLALFYQYYFFKTKRQEAEQLLKVSLDSEKKERERIAADLHDSVLADLSAIRNYALLLQKTRPEIKLEPVFTEMRSGIETAIENTRLISYKLMPPLLQSFGIVAALNDYATRITKSTGIKCQVICSQDIKLSPTVSYEIFRVLQEFTSNLIKHGCASQCSISFELEKDKIHITVKDNGKSFNFAEHAKTSKGLGIGNINSRLRFIGATLSQSVTTKGNIFHIYLKQPE